MCAQQLSPAWHGAGKLAAPAVLLLAWSCSMPGEESRTHLSQAVHRPAGCQDGLDVWGCEPGDILVLGDPNDLLMILCVSQELTVSLKPWSSLGFMES